MNIAGILMQNCFISFSDEEFALMSDNITKETFREIVKWIENEEQKKSIRNSVEQRKLS